MPAASDLASCPNCPMRYALFTCALWWLSVELQGVDLSQQPRGFRIYFAWAQWINLVLLPPLAVPFWLAFLGTRTRYAEHLAGLFFVAGHMFLCRAALAGLGAWQPGWGMALNRVDAVLFPSYVALALWNWQRPRPGTPAQHAVVVARVAAAIALLILGSGYLVNGSVRLLIRILP